jgi:hypothetical protein
MKFTCHKSPSVHELPSWVTVEKRGHNFVFVIDYKDESLLSYLIGEFDSPVDMKKFLESQGFSGVNWLPLPMRVAEDCYLQKLNVLFTNGIPFVEVFPTVLVMGKPCFEIQTKWLSRGKKKALTEAYQQVGVPFSLWRVWVEQKLAVIPCEFVETLEVVSA